MRSWSTLLLCGAFATLLLCLAAPTISKDPTALALVDRHTDPKISATTIDAVFNGAACLGTSCVGYGVYNQDDAAVTAGFAFGVFGGAIRLIAGLGVAFGAFDWRKETPIPRDHVYYPRLFEPGARHNCTIEGKYGLQQLSRVGNKGAFKLRTECWHPVKRAPGSIEAYVQEETDNGYPPDNGWLDESAQAFADGINEYGADQEAYCVKFKNYLDSTAYMYIAIDGDDTNDEFTGVVGCDSVSHEA